MPTGNIPRFTHQAHTYEMPVKNAFTYSLCLATLLFLPIWVQHLTAADGGITAVGGGKISEEEIFGKTNKKGVTVGGYPKLMFHASRSSATRPSGSACWQSWCRTTAT